MKKIIPGLSFMLILFINVMAKGDNPQHVLRFNEQGKFKIVQFTDIHFQYNSFRSDSALLMMKMVLEKEKPDLVVLTGDVVCSKNTHQAWLSLSKVLIEAQIPWAVTLGNHDTEYELTGKEIMETISGLPYSLSTKGPENISGNGNYILRVHSSQSSDTEALLYFFDSHSGFHPETNLGSYEWIKFDQIQWYREQSNIFTKENDGKVYPALAFFHIPLPEYNEIIGLKTTVGTYKEKVCCPDINTGMYAAMLESKDVMGMFVGHDHDNNYIGCLRGICMAYGQSSGRQCYGKIGRGARVIELYEGERKFDTWVLNLYKCNRDRDIWKPSKSYQQDYFVSYPGSFIEK